MHLNGDDAMALGAAFIAANLSHSFKVKSINLYDGHSYPIFAKILSEDPKLNREFELFKYKSPYGSK